MEIPDFLEAEIPGMNEWDSTLLSAPEAAELHKDLARNGIKSHEHSDFASSVMSREVSSLQQLTRAEAKQVFQAAVNEARSAEAEEAA